jgi:exopolyphosphatase/guanosine-5'-triphosphate,3'-diphosphate pyrophosphatase
MRVVQAPQRTVGVIDIGSNSGRCVVFELAPGGHIHVVRDTRAPLRLARELERRESLSNEAIDRTLDALRDFRSVVEGADTRWILAVATSAVRESTNAMLLVDRAAEAGIDLRVITGESEARLAFMGAAYGLPIHHGLLIDVGGGSMEVASFRDRVLVRSWTLPLGALRISDDFLSSDPPAKKDLKRMRDHIATTLADARIPSLDADEVLVGTGGTVRNLAKVDRKRRSYPIQRLHGYEVTADGVGSIAEALAEHTAAQRARMAGLNPDRIDSVVGGAFVVAGVLERVGARHILVSGLGLREGLALQDSGVDRLPGPALVRQASIAALGSRFTGWSLTRAERTASLARSLLDAAAPGLPDEIRETVHHAAHMLEMGGSIDFYNRQDHAAQLVAGSDLLGFSHRDLALLAALIRFSESDRFRMKVSRPLLTDADRTWLARAGVALEVADELDARFPPGMALASEWRVEGRRAVLVSPAPPAWSPSGLARRFKKAFGLQLVPPRT